MRREHHEEVHDQHRGPRVEAGQQRDGAAAVDAPQTQVVEAGAPHLLVRPVPRGAENLRPRRVPGSPCPSLHRCGPAGLPARRAALCAVSAARSEATAAAR